MNPGEHAQMAAVEDDHWWYRGLRDLLVRALAHHGLPPRPRILDAGCVTGANLRALAEAFTPSYLAGFDVSEEALEIARGKAPSAHLFRSDVCDPELPTDALDLVVSLDVIYIPGVEASIDGLRRIVRSLRPGGLFVVNLPAYDWLYSEHDVAVHTSERYTAPRVRALLERLDLRVELLTHRLAALLPLVVLHRLPRMIGARRGDLRARSDLTSVPGPRLNAALLRAVVAENGMIVRGHAMPFGSSVFAIGRRD